MNFVTLNFAVFFFCVLCLFSVSTRSAKTYKFFLLAFNLAFYAFAGVQFLPLLLGVAFINYASAKLTNARPLKKAGFRKAVITLAAALQILILAFYKYYEFFVLSAEKLLNLAGVEYSLIGLLPHTDILLPVGLSFYIFQGLSYSIDRYRDTGLKALGYFDVLLFVSFFPTVLAGPIMRSNQFFPQFAEDPAPDDEEYKKLERKCINADIAEGFAYILSGLFKKVVIASYLSEHIVRDVFQNPDFYSSETVLVAMYAYAMQIFCDFSGYTDLALGIGRLMGIKIPQNFNAPYLAVSLQDFWRRWHISLSQWLRDYLYISLGGNRKGNKYVNLFITMTLGGLWHGSHLRFLVWGMAHGLGLVVNHAWKTAFTDKIFGKGRKNSANAADTKQADRSNSADTNADTNTKTSTENTPKRTHPALKKIYAFVCWFLTFHCVCVLWLFFRADSTQSALAMLKRIFAFTAQGDGYALLVPAAILAAMFIQIFGKYCFNGVRITLEKAWFPLKIAILVLLTALILKMGPDGVLPFIYFQF